MSRRSGSGYGSSSGRVRGGMGANQANVTLNIIPSLNQETLSRFYRSVETPTADLKRYPVTQMRNTSTRGDLCFRIRGSKDAAVFSDFSGVLVPKSAAGKYKGAFDHNETIYDIVEFVGVMKNPKIHADGGALFNDNDANTPGHQVGALFIRGTDTILADCGQSVQAGQLLVWVAPRYKSESDLPTNHRFLATIEPLSAKHYTELWTDSQYAFMDHILHNQRNLNSAGPITALGGNARAGDKQRAPKTAALAEAEFKRDILNAMAVLHVLNATEKVKISNVQTKMTDAFAAWALRYPLSVAPQNVTNAKAAIASVAPDRFDSNDYEFDGTNFTPRSAKNNAFSGTDAATISQSLNNLCGLMKDLGLYDPKSGLFKPMVSNRKSNALQELAAVLSSLPIDQVKKQFSYPFNPFVQHNRVAGVDAQPQEIINSFQKDLADAQNEARLMVMSEIKRLNKRVIGKTITTSPGNPGGIELVRGSLNAPQVDIDINCENTLIK